ncbi:MAG: M24 family metallopeptidase [Geminicoccaceae bacterium]
MPLHFSDATFERRRRAVLETMAEARLDGMLLFKQESLFWLTGYDTFGFCFFQCLVLTRRGDLALLTRAPDLRQAQHTSLIDNIRIWVDRAGASPCHDLVDLAGELGLTGARLGVEFDCHGLTALNGFRLRDAFIDRAELVDASRLVAGLRMVKDEEERTYVRRAGVLADAALEAAIERSRAGADESDILAAMQASVFKGGGDYPGNAFIIGSGRGALLCRYFSGRRTLDAQDQLTLEFAGAYRHYHAAMMRTLIIGKPDKRHERMFDACHEALASAEAKLRPGETMGSVYQAQADTLDRHGMRAHRLNACGYSLGAMFGPSWMDDPMFYQDNPEPIREGMVLFVHIILMDSNNQRAMTLGRTSIIASDGPEALSKAPLELIVC